MKKSVFVGPMPYGFTWGLVLLKDLPKTTNTVWYFHAQIKIMEYHVYNVVKNDEIMAINLEHNEKR